MTEYRFHIPIQLRYADLDPQWHVNNARFLSFLEQARLAYVMQLGFFDGESFFDLGLIVADLHIAYRAPIKLTQNIRVGMRCTRLGNKSMHFDYVVEDVDTGEVAATAETVMVYFDYHDNISKPVPDLWRQKIAAFEGIPERA